MLPWSDAARSLEICVYFPSPKVSNEIITNLLMCRDLVVFCIRLWLLFPNAYRLPPTAWRAYTFSIPLAFGVIFGTMFKNLSLVAKTDTCACVGEWLSICTYVCVLVLRFGRLCVYIMNTATEMFVRFLFTLREWMSWVLISYSYARIHQPRIFTAEPISKRISLKSMLQYFRQYIHI